MWIQQWCKIWEIIWCVIGCIIDILVISMPWPLQGNPFICNEWINELVLVVVFLMLRHIQSNSVPDFRQTSTVVLNIWTASACISFSNYQKELGIQWYKSLRLICPGLDFALSWLICATSHFFVPLSLFCSLSPYLCVCAQPINCARTVPHASMKINCF